MLLQTLKKDTYLILGGQGSPPREKKSKNWSDEGGARVCRKRHACPGEQQVWGWGNTVCSGCCKQPRGSGGRGGEENQQRPQWGQRVERPDLKDPVH